MPHVSEYNLTATVFNTRKNKAALVEKRKQLIREAVAFPSGSPTARERSVISTLSNDKIAYFEKPGKETKRKVPNKFDMYPNVGTHTNGNFDSWAFEQIWEYIIKISIIQQMAFKKVLVLLYRLCYFYDHKEQDGKLRYTPDNSVLSEIKNLDRYVLQDGFQEKFGSSETGLLEFLHFVDLLAWNEDVKYHTQGNGLPDNLKKFDTGRINTVLSIICAPLLISKFIRDIITKTEKKSGFIDIKLITKTIQIFSKTRGICVLSKKELLTELSPYLTEEKNG